MTLANMVQETASAPGAATTINLAGPATGRRSFIAAFGGGGVVDYVMDDGTQYETGIGTVTAGSPNTLTRTTVIENSAGTLARLNFTGSTRVYAALRMDRIGWMMVEAPRVVSAVAQVDFALPTYYRAFRLRMIRVTADAVRAPYIRFSTDGGSTFLSTSIYSTYGIYVTSTGPASTPAAVNNIAVGGLGPSIPVATPNYFDATVDITPATASLVAMWRAQFIGPDATQWYQGTQGGQCNAGAVTNAVRIFPGTANAPAGTFSGVFELEGLR